MTSLQWSSFSYGELRNEGEMELSAAIGEEFGEGVADLGFVAEVKLSDLVERGVVVLYRGVRRLEGKRHLWRISLHPERGGGGRGASTACRCSKIMSPPNCNETLSPSQGW